MDTLTRTRKTIRFKGRSFLALVLSPEHPLDEWFREFDDLRERSPSFFIGRPLILDVSGLNLDREAMQTIVADLFERRVRVMAVEGAKASALGLGLPPGISGGRLVDDLPEPVDERPQQAAPVHAAAPVETPAVAVPSPVVQPAIEPRPAMPSMLIEAPVRSGQSIMFPEGDVTIIGSVASGAEIVAGGSIHVYGALRGRRSPLHGQREGPHLRPEIRSRAHRHRRALSGRGRTEAGTARPSRPDPARGRHDLHLALRLSRRRLTDGIDERASRTRTTRWPRCWW